MKLLDRYDWIVLGDSPGALLSGWLVARLGLKVLFLSFGPSEPPRVCSGGQYFDPESDFFLAGGSPGQAVPSPIDALFSASPVSARFAKTWREPRIEVAAPGLRAQVGADAHALSRELTREWGREAASLAWLAHGWEALSARTLAAWAAYPKALTLTLSDAPQGRRLGSARRVKSAAPMPALPGTSAFLKNKSRSEPLRHWYTNGDGTRQPADEFRRGWRFALGGVTTDGLGLAPWGMRCVGGMSVFRSIIRDAAVAEGAHAPAETDCKRIFVADGRVVGVQAANRASAVTAGGVMIGCAIEHAREVMNFDHARAVKRLRVPPRPSGWRFTLALTVRASAVASHAPGDRIVWVEPEAPELEIEWVDPSERGLDERGSYYLFVRTVVPYEEESLGREYQRLLASRMFKQVVELYPFLEFSVVRMTPDFRGNSAEADYPQAYESLRSIPVSLRHAAAEARGAVRDDPAAAGIEGLFLGTHEADPRWASFSEVRAAIDGTTWIAHRTGLSGPNP